MDKALSLIGLMRKANRISLTEDKCREDIKNGRSQLVLIASDCSERVSGKIRVLCENYDVECITAVYTEAELAAAAGSGLCSVISINDSGFSKAFLELEKA